MFILCKTLGVKKKSDTIFLTSIVKLFTKRVHLCQPLINNKDNYKRVIILEPEKGLQGFLWSWHQTDD